MICALLYADVGIEATTRDRNLEEVVLDSEIRRATERTQASRFLFNEVQVRTTGATILVSTLESLTCTVELGVFVATGTAFLHHRTY